MGMMWLASCSWGALTLGRSVQSFADQSELPWSPLRMFNTEDNSIMVILWEFVSLGTAINSPLVTFLQQHL